MISEVSVSLLAIAGFGVVLWWSQIVAATHQVVDLGLSGLMSMLDSEATDATKEVAVRRAGLGLVTAGFGLLVRLVGALAAGAVPIVVADRLGWAPRDSVVELMLRPDYLLGVSALAIVSIVAVRRWRPAPDTSIAPDTPYSTADRFFHAVAFSSPRVLKATSRIEDRLLDTASPEPSGPPMFITSLARGGTTALLNALHDVPGVATHTYRDMPFVTAPNLWNRISGGPRRRVERHERAHGDGLEIDLDSPEAFEEVIWRMFWPDRYRGSCIPPWRAGDRDDEAEHFLRRHMQKVIHARLANTGDEAAGTARYCSKNNANIARIPYLTEAFAGCRIVVPIRRPECHAASLRRQHQNFSARQTDDDFVARYMRDIGHFEFGVIHKPIRFPGFDPDELDPGMDDYWLSYWLRAFRHVLDHRDSCILVSQDRLRSSPEETMATLCDAVDLPNHPATFAGYFHSSPDRSPTDPYDQDLLDEAGELYRELEAIAV